MAIPSKSLPSNDHPKEKEIGGPVGSLFELP